MGGREGKEEGEWGITICVLRGIGIGNRKG